MSSDKGPMADGPWDFLFYIYNVIGKKMMISREAIYEKALCLLRGALWQQQCDVSVDAQEWMGIRQFASEQALDGIMSDALLYLPQESMPPKAMKMLMIAVQLRVQKANEHMNDVLQEFTAELAKRSIPYVLRRGKG